MFDTSHRRRRHIVFLLFCHFMKLTLSLDAYFAELLVPEVLVVPQFIFPINWRTIQVQFMVVHLICPVISCISCCSKVSTFSNFLQQYFHDVEASNITKLVMVKCFARKFSSNFTLDSSGVPSPEFAQERKPYWVKFA